MGQYYKLINFDKKEFVNPHELGSGLKAWECLANHPGVAAAMIVLMVSSPEIRGGGDLNSEHCDICHCFIGRWAGDRVALVGDYAEVSDLSSIGVDSKQAYEDCEDETVPVWTKRSTRNTLFRCMIPGDPHYGLYEGRRTVKASLYKNISKYVAHVIEAELDGRFVGTGWKEWKPNYGG
jgi:hypothetical protein